MTLRETGGPCGCRQPHGSATSRRNTLLPVGWLATAIVLILVCSVASPQETRDESRDDGRLWVRPPEGEVARQYQQHPRPAPNLRNWRTERVARIELPPDPSRITILPTRAGRARVIGAPGATGDRRARMIRVVNLRTTDEVIVSVRADGAFDAELFAPPGSSLQINTSMVVLEDLPPHFREMVTSAGALRPSDIPQGRAEQLTGMVASHWSASPATILTVVDERQPPGSWPGFVKKVGLRAWCFGRATLAPRNVRPGDQVTLSVDLSHVSDRRTPESQTPNRLPTIIPTLHLLFDQQGRQCAHMRLSASHLLTPSGLPIEAHNEMAVEPLPNGGRQWHPAGQGYGMPWRTEKRDAWRHENGAVSSRQTLRFEVPDQLPTGWYGVSAHLAGLGQEDYESAEFDGGPWYLGCLKVGNPNPCRLACLLLGSVGPGGTRGTVAREDRGHYAINPRNLFPPEKLVIPRDDPYTGQPIRYPLDPYLPLVSRADRPQPVIRHPRIPLCFSRSRLKVTVTAPDGTTRTLGPKLLVAGQHDLSVLRPDYVVRDRIAPPIAPSYGNPSLGDMYHLTGRGAFDYAFRQYGRHVVELDGEIRDVAGNLYRIAGTYDVYVAHALGVDVFPEPGTPLQPGVELTPQVRVHPAVPADVEIRWRHYPHSDVRRLVARTIRGKANRFGVFVPKTFQKTTEQVPSLRELRSESSVLGHALKSSERPVSFDAPGEYVCDVTVQYRDRHGALWMASRRGASVVVTPNSNIVVHGERGNRSPTARWRARWFLAGDNRFVAPPAVPEPPPPRGEPVDPSAPTKEFQINLGHTCYPYEPGDVAWLGPQGNFSLFPNLTFEDPQGTVSQSIERRWPGVRRGEGREGLYPYELMPEDRRAIGEMPYVCMTFTGLPPSMAPKDVDQWGYFYTTSWRPGIGVRAQVSEDTVPTGYWFFDDPYGWQLGVGPQGDLAGDVKMNYGGGVFRDLFSGTTHYGGYASMLVLTRHNDPLGARVLPPFDGLLPGSPRSGPLLEIGGKRYDVFLTFGAVGPGAVLEVGDSLRVGGVLWPPVSGHVEGTIVAPSGKKFTLQAPADAMGLFDSGGPVANQPGVWQVTIEGVCSGKTSAGTIAELVPQDQWPRGSGVGLQGTTFHVPVVTHDAEPIRFDVPTGSRASPPTPLVLRGHVPRSARAKTVELVVSMPGQVIDRQSLPVHNATVEYRYDPERLRRAFPNIDTRIEVPFGELENSPAWFDTVTFTFWAGRDARLVAGTVLLQGEQLYAQAASGRPLPQASGSTIGPSWPSEVDRPTQPAPNRPPWLRPRRQQLVTGTIGRQTGSHSSLLQLVPGQRSLIATHPWSGEVVRLEEDGARLRVVATALAGGEPRSLALSPDGRRVYVALAAASRIVVLDAKSLEPLTLYNVPATPRAAVCSGDGSKLFVADFRGDRILRLSASTGQIEAQSESVNRPAALAFSPDRGELYTVSFRTGEVVVLDEQCRVRRRLPARAQLGQCDHVTLGPNGLLYAPQTRADTVLGGRMFDRTVFPAIAVADLQAGRMRVEYSPDLLVVPPHRPAEVAVDQTAVYLASAGSDDVLAIDRKSGFALWHAAKVGREPGGIALDSATGRLYVLTITGQSIVTLNAKTGGVLSHTRFAHDQTPSTVARGRYLFGTATDARLTKDQWMSCAVCHPGGDEDGRQWDFGAGALDTRSLRGCLETTPLHVTAHLDEIEDTYHFTRMTMGGRWFVSREAVHESLGESNAGQDADLDALATFIRSLKPRPPPAPPPALGALVERGREIFFSDETGCAKCHPPSWYTDSGKRSREGKFVLHNVGTQLSPARERAQRLDTPSLLSLRRSAPYLHHGQAKTLEQVLTKFNPADKHGRTSHLSRHDIHALVEFLRHLEPREANFF